MRQVGVFVAKAIDLHVDHNDLRNDLIQCSIDFADGKDKGVLDCCPDLQRRFADESREPESVTAFGERAHVKEGRV